MRLALGQGSLGHGRRRGQADQVQGQVENALGQFSDSVRQQPLTYVLAGVGVGWLLGRLRII